MGTGSVTTCLKPEGSNSCVKLIHRFDRKGLSNDIGEQLKVTCGGACQCRYLLQHSSNFSPHDRARTTLHSEESRSLIAIHFTRAVRRPNIDRFILRDESLTGDASTVNCSEDFDVSTKVRASIRSSLCRDPDRGFVVVSFRSFPSGISSCDFPKDFSGSLIETPQTFSRANGGITRICEDISRCSCEPEFKEFVRDRQLNSSNPAAQSETLDVPPAFRA